MFNIDYKYLFKEQTNLFSASLQCLSKINKSNAKIRLCSVQLLYILFPIIFRTFVLMPFFFAGICVCAIYTTFGRATS